MFKLKKKNLNTMFESLGGGGSGEEWGGEGIRYYVNLQKRETSGKSSSWNLLKYC